MEIQIYKDNSAGVVKHQGSSNDPKAYFTLQGESQENKDLAAVFMGAAPVVAINVTEAVDYDLHKGLNGGYLLASFGYAPTKIDMSGVDIYTSSSSCAFGKDIKSWWDAYNLGASPQSRIRLGLYSGGTTTTYLCVVISILRTTQGDSAGVGTYKMSFIGVKI